MKTIKFESEGFVYGNLWGGGEGAYPARKLQANKKADLIKQANEGLGGSLDSGMGYESLMGAILEIKTITTVDIKGKPFTNEETDIEFIGELTPKQEEFLFELLMNN